MPTGKLFRVGLFVIVTLIVATQLPTVSPHLDGQDGYRNNAYPHQR